MADFVYDPFSGMPIPDPSGELARRGYETSPADAAKQIGENVETAVAKAATSVFTGLKILVVVALVVGAIIIVAQARRALGT